MEKRIDSENDNFFSNILFVSDLPKETKCKDLEILFKKYHFLKASLNNSRLNKIYAQVVLETEILAEKARHELNGFFLIPETAKNDKSKGKSIRICRYESKLNLNNNSVDINKNLLIKNIPDNMNQQEFYNIFLKYGDICSGKIEYDENGKSKGYGYIYYYDVSSAEKAKLELNGKKFYEKPLEIVNCIPSKAKNKLNNLTLFLVNLPSNITEPKLKSLFNKYGNIINIQVTDKGYAYITFSDCESASKCIIDIKKNPISFYGLPQVIVKYATSKEERQINKNFNFNNNEKNENLCKIYFQLIKDDNNEINNEIELEKNIRLFIKIIFVMEYIPKSVEINYSTKSGVVVFNNIKDSYHFLKKYSNYCINNKPIFLCIPFNQAKIKNNIKFINLNNYINNKNSNNINIEQNIKHNLSNNNKYDDNFKIENNKIINTTLSNIALNGSEIIDNNFYSNDNQINDLTNRQNLSSSQLELIQNKNNVVNVNNMNNYFAHNNMILSNINNPINNNLNNNYINGNINISQLKYKNKFINNYQINPNQIPNLLNVIQNKNKNYYNNFNQSLNINSKNNNDNYQEIIKYIFNSIYNKVQIKYPDYAGIITGMINGLGPKKMITLLSNPEQLNIIIEKAYKMIVDKKEKNG